MSAGHRAMGAHHSARPLTTTWLTPPPIIEAMGGASSFDLDPCTIEASPIPTARDVIFLPTDGLAASWDGRVWLNPPYTSDEIGPWLARLADHGHGAALIFARTETEAFYTNVWGRAHGVLFLKGRLHFHYADGTRAKANAGAPSVLVAYGADELDRLAACGLPGGFNPLRFARGVLVAAMDRTWQDEVLAWVRRQGGPVTTADLYRAFRRHPKASRNPHWRAKLRQTLQRGPFERVAPAVWAAA